MRPRDWVYHVVAGVLCFVLMFATAALMLMTLVLLGA